MFAKNHLDSFSRFDRTPTCDIQTDWHKHRAIASTALSSRRVARVKIAWQNRDNFLGVFYWLYMRLLWWHSSYHYCLIGGSMLEEFPEISCHATCSRVQKTGLFLRVDNYVTKACDMSTVSTQTLSKKVQNLDGSEVKYSLRSLPKYSVHSKLSRIWQRYGTIRDTIRDTNVRSKADMSQLNLPHGNDN